MFVIDVEGIWTGGPEHVSKLKSAILRLLTYYRDRKRRAMWGHRFFNTGKERHISERVSAMLRTPTSRPVPHSFDDDGVTILFREIDLFTQSGHSHPGQETPVPPEHREKVWSKLGCVLKSVYDVYDWKPFQEPLGMGKKVMMYGEQERTDRHNCIVMFTECPGVEEMGAGGGGLIDEASLANLLGGNAGALDAKACADGSLQKRFSEKKICLHYWVDTGASGASTKPRKSCTAEKEAAALCGGGEGGLVSAGGRWGGTAQIHDVRRFAVELTTSLGGGHFLDMEQLVAPLALPFAN